MLPCLAGALALVCPWSQVLPADLPPWLDLPSSCLCSCYARIGQGLDRVTDVVPTCPVGHIIQFPTPLVHLGPQLVRNLCAGLPLAPHP